MLIPLIAVLIAFAILVWSADLFVAGAASIAENMGMSPVVIGLTIVSLGTSAPEILVSITAALSGSGGLAIGNAVGSNIANIGLVLGITLLVTPIIVYPGCIRTEMPTLLAVTAGAGLLLMDLELERGDAILMIATLALIMWQMVRTSKDPVAGDEVDEDELPHLSPLKAWLSFVAGLALLIGSSRMLVWGASDVATQLGVPELVIGLTIVAVGTSLPELAATIASSLRGHAEIAMGNIVGSNLFNLLVVMAMPGLLVPEQISGNFLLRDYAAMSFFTLALTAALFLGRNKAGIPEGHTYLGRTVGLLFCVGYGLYYYWLFTTT